MSQCEGEKQDGTQCQREASEGEYCWQHGGPKVKNDKETRARKGTYKFNDIVRKKILNALRNGSPVKLACQAAGIRAKTLYRWREKFPDFDADVMIAMAEGSQQIVESIRNEAIDGDWRAGAWLLQKRHPEIFGDDVSAEDAVESIESDDKKEKIKKLLTGSDG